ncbi:MAG: hypothetical protein KJ000_11345 [Pirellulaceae bacterium]|nr:hypothetical protein [Pirellulaceae bacterium]
MARWLRVWEKKRGTRRTGSKLVGTLGEILFSATLFVLGGVSLMALLASQAIPALQPFRPGFGFWVMVLVLSSFMLLGGGGVLWTWLHAGTSPERRSAIAKRAASLDLTADPTAQRLRLPSIPSDANLTNSPGIKQRYRLPVVQSPAWRLMFATVFCVVWNVSAAILVVVAVSGFLRNDPEWFLTIFTIPFLVVGGWSVYDFVRQWLLHAGIGPTNVEISDHPLQPGRGYLVYLSQSGRLAMKALAVNLVCEEAATYRQGTDIRIEHKRVFDRQIYRQTDFRIEPGKAFEHELRLEIPADAMHSFQSEHNAINWKLVIHGEADAWPPFERCFPIIVYPRYDGHEDTDRTADLAQDLPS